MDTGHETPIFVFKLAVPKTQKLAFEAVFKGVDSLTQDTLAQLSSVREDLRNVLNSDNLVASLSAIDKYLPSLFGLQQAASTMPAEFSKWLRVIWNTPIGTRNFSNPCVNESFHFEVVMSLLTVVILYRNQASDLLKEALLGGRDFEELSKNVAQLLCKAAGVAQYIAVEKIPSWFVKPDGPLPESCAETFLALESICLAEAQQIAIRKGFLKGMSTSVLAKLSRDVADKFDYAHKQLTLASSPNNQVLPPLLSYCMGSSHLWRGVTYRLLAQEAVAGGQYGSALGALRDGQLPAMVKDASLENFLSIYNIERDFNQKLYAQLTRENDTIYFEVVQSVPLPEGRCLMKTVPFAPPQAFPITIGIADKSKCIIC